MRPHSHEAGRWLTISSRRFQGFSDTRGNLPRSKATKAELPALVLHDHDSCAPSKLAPHRSYLLERDAHRFKPDMNRLVEEIRFEQQSVIRDVNAPADPKSTVLLPPTLALVPDSTKHQGGG